MRCVLVDRLHSFESLTPLHRYRFGGKKHEMGRGGGRERENTCAVDCVETVRNENIVVSSHIAWRTKAYEGRDVEPYEVRTDFQGR